MTEVDKLQAEWDQLRGRESDLSEREKDFENKKELVKQVQNDVHEKQAALATLKAEIKHKEKQLQKDSEQGSAAAETLKAQLLQEEELRMFSEGELISARELLDQERKTHTHTIQQLQDSLQSYKGV
eukprot:GHVR01144009.1.p1 GENE.GHVR01144009.1~~GHVR01144009.1.p1  ORF type:complete len:127 (+),score=54.54 GHVR01144009.1:61-441(+)